MFNFKAGAVIASLALLVFGTHALFAADIPAAGEHGPETEEVWFQLRMLDEPAGDVRETIIREGGRVTEISSRLTLRLRRFGDAMEIQSHERFLVGTPPTLETRILQAEGDTLDRTYIFGPDSLYRLGPGGETETLAPLPPNLVLPPAIETWFEGAWTVGETRTRSEFSSDTELLVQSRVTAESRESWEWQDETISGFRFLIEIEGMPELVRSEWRSSDGRLFRARTDLLGLEITRSAVAVQRREAGPALDSSMLLPIDFDFKVATVYERIRYRARWNPDRTAFRPLHSPNVRILSADTLECLFDVERPSSDTTGTPLTSADPARPAPGPTGDLPTDPTAEHPSLSPSPWIESEDREIVAAAEKAIRGAKDPWEQVERLTQFVHDHILDKSYGVYFASARSTLDAQEGDCTEHAVLLAALGRAVGIPTRLVSGWIGIGSEMGYHLWTEVYVGGNWIGVDGVFARAPIDARYLPLAVSDLANGSSSELTLAVLQNLGGLRLNVLQAIAATP